ncbi:MAG: NfeD family protein [Nitrospiria bacterium]
MIFGLSNSVFWFVVSIAGLIIEVVVGGFWILFFGAGALLTSFLVWMGILQETDWQILCFVISSILMLGLFRKPLVKNFGKKTSADMNDPAGQMVEVIQEIPKGGTGKVEFQGSPWEARSEEETAIPVSSKVKIVRQEGLKLWVKKI